MSSKGQNLNNFTCPAPYTGALIQASTVAWHRQSVFSVTGEMVLGGGPGFGEFPSISFWSREASSSEMSNRPEVRKFGASPAGNGLLYIQRH